MPEVVITGYPANLKGIQVTIASGASKSEMIATQGMALVGIVMPGWTAAAIGYESCVTGNAADLQPVQDGGANLLQTLVTANRNVAFPTADAIFVPWLRLTSVTAGSVTGVNQGADRNIVLLFRNYLN